VAVEVLYSEDDFSEYNLSLGDGEEFMLLDY